ncbi:aminoglycoside phosphotransferase family protein [Nocardia fusca]|uniref:Aminoglycoside phosphotransferase family protein n=1 Tax=Nocardia fusca TaxID=941183 RepID=A0ABV3FE63_9NOCA
MTDSSDGRAGIDVRLVEQLIAAQFPRWSRLPVTPVAHDGHDNRTYRLGEELTVRLPTAASYAAGIAKESRWLPSLGPALPLQIPVVLADGAPGSGYPFPWSVRRWIPGETPDHARIDDMTGFAVSLAEFLRALQCCDTTGAPVAGEHSFYRGAALHHYDRQTRHCLAVLADEIDVGAAAAVWERALTSEWGRRPVWFHGDLAVGNLLVESGRLSAVIDFGTCGIGDPACDLVPAWTMLSGAGRSAFRDTTGQDSGTWDRARGWHSGKRFSPSPTTPSISAPGH